MNEALHRLSLGHFPTPVQYLDKLSGELGKSIFVKRDDFSGSDVSGNKIRKLEYALAEALDQGADTIVTCGAVQSNHCRATASACARLGLPCHLVIRGEAPACPEGNLFLDYMYGAKVRFCPDPEQFQSECDAVLDELVRAGRKPYFIPVGASNAIGSQGYRRCFQEILTQEEELGIRFDLICLAVGSGGTYAGLHFENAVTRSEKAILGISVSASAEDFKRDIALIEQDLSEQEERPVKITEPIWIEDGYVGSGYAKSTPEELRFLADIARKTGILFDPCYTGKGFFGLVSEICRNRLKDSENILFIHTGGLMGWTEAQRAMTMEAAE